MTQKTHPADGGAEERVKPQTTSRQSRKGHRSAPGRGFPGDPVAALCTPAAGGCGSIPGWGTKTPRAQGCLWWAGRPQRASCPECGEVAARARPAHAGGGPLPSEAGSTRGMEQEEGREHELHAGHALIEEPVDTQQRCILCSQSGVQESGARVERQTCLICV